MSGDRRDGRRPDELRPLTIEPGFMRTATGSALISMGGTRVICTASVEESVPKWMAGKGRGWVTAEYGMLPASTGDRKQRDVSKGRADGRTVEIQRLIGRSLRGVIDFAALGERTVWIDCDVLEADGGTRTAAISGGYVALQLALDRLIDEGKLGSLPLTGSIAAISCGMVDGRALLDLDYSEDSTAEVDTNVVMTGDGGLVEVQATAERTPLSRASLDELLALAAGGIEQIRVAQAGSPASCRSQSRREAGPRHAQRAQAARVPGAARAARARPAARRRDVAAGNGRDLRGERVRKAEAARDATGMAAVADDSGIEAAALGGRPGVRSARYAGESASDEENLAKLLADVPVNGDRRVAYACALAYAEPGAETRVFTERCEGLLAAEPRGDGGFGYDPAFVPVDRDDGRTMAELGWKRRMRSATAAAPRARSSTGSETGDDTRARGHAESDAAAQDARGRDLDRLERHVDRAQARGGRDHGLDRGDHRGDPLGDRPDGVDGRLLLGAQGRRAARRVTPLRPREGRERSRGNRGHADPGRRRDHHLRVRPPADRALGHRADRRRHRGNRVLRGRELRGVGVPLPPGASYRLAGARGRRGAPAHGRVHIRASSLRSCWSR